MDSEASVVVREDALSQRRDLPCAVCGKAEGVPFLDAPDRFHGRQQIYRLVRCPSCSLVWLQDPPAPERMGEHYGLDYDRAVAAAGDAHERWRGRVKTIARYKSGGFLLDLGCSSGGFLQSMNGSWKLHGIEMSQAVADRAKSMSGAEVFAGDILEAPYAPKSFDVITCFHVFEHLYRPLAVLKKVADWLKPGGIFYVMVPNIDSAGEHIFKSYWYALELPRHLHHFSPKSLSHVARLAGLETVSLSTHREPFIEKSIRYCLDDMCRRAGKPRVSLARSKEPGIPFRLIRKAFRLTALPILNGMTAFAGDGESIHAIFMKPMAPR
jgi:2-polyprenyl-3-methyl-5-hydroxy-6-metoxy-1,4-benzoquinol methylase